MYDTSSEPLLPVSCAVWPVLEEWVEQEVWPAPSPAH